jgi:hypothetical protein
VLIEEIVESLAAGFEVGVVAGCKKERAQQSEKSDRSEQPHGASEKRGKELPGEEGYIVTPFRRPEFMGFWRLPLLAAAGEK